MLALNLPLKPSVKPSVRGLATVGSGSESVLQKSLYLLAKFSTFNPKTGHESPDSDPRLQFQTLFGQGVTN